jgi:hypothetical protein
MANSSLTVSSLDFDTLKDNLKSFLSNQSAFKDYDFEGSNINVLLDVLSYNSYLNSFYLNMVASEMFLDSAQKYDTVISHSKELNYVPISSSSSQADISITFETVGLNGVLTIPKGTKFSGTNSNNSYQFVTRETNVVYSGNNTYTANLTIHEGSYFKDSFIFDETEENLLLKLSNKNIDLDSLTVTVSENNGANVYTFARAETLFRLTKNSEVFFVQGSDTNSYEIVFGDNILGRKPQHLSTIVAEYVVNNGEKSNGIAKFGLNGDLSKINSGQVNVSNIVTLKNSNNGADQETIDSIKYNAPRHFAAQYRAISTDDYASIILSKFGGKVSDVIIYGGQELEPKLYGRVVVSLKPTNSTVASDTLKNEIKNYLLDYIALPNRIIISDPETFYCKIDTTVQYDSKTGNKTINQIKNILAQDIIDFSKDHLEKFGNDFRYSKFVAHIDSSDDNITSNDTHVKLVKQLTPSLNVSTPISINFNNSSEKDIDDLVLTSDPFTYVSSDGTKYPLAQLKDDSNGTIIVFTVTNGKEAIINSKIGTIDYMTGKVVLSNFKVSSYNNHISVYYNTTNKDIIATKNMILYFSPIYTSINVIEVVK